MYAILWQADCSHSSIIGSKSGVGIYNNGSDNIKVINCNVSYFGIGIYLKNVNGNNLTNNSVSDHSHYGILLENVNNSQLLNNTVRYGGNDGVRFVGSNDNRFSWNEVCASVEVDINVVSGNDNRGEENRCNVTSGWNDDGAVGCKYPCEVCLDSAPPTITVLSPENTTYTTSNIPLSFTLDESTPWIGYCLDGQANVTISGNTTLTGLTDGSHTIIVYANDTAGNTGASETIYFSIAKGFPWMWLIVTIAVVVIGLTAVSTYSYRIRKS